MRQFHEAWSPVFVCEESKSVTVAADLDEAGVFESRLLSLTKRLPSAIDLQADEFLGLGFTHHMEILHKTSGTAERLFYIYQTYQNHWDK